MTYLTPESIKRKKLDTEFHSTMMNPERHIVVL